MIPESILIELESFHKEKPKDISSVGGGSINEAYRYKCNNKDFFIKFNKSGSEIIAKEVDGLKAIGATNTIAVPEIIFFSDNGSYEFLVLNFIQGGNRSAKAWQRAGELLAQLHSQEAPYYGWSNNNFIGSAFQNNDKKHDFLSFFIQNRLMPQVEWAKEQGRLKTDDIHHFEKLYEKLPDILPDNLRPSLVHGDLWGGNFMIGQNDTPYLIDPSIQYNFRETDIAFTHLFGGFDQEFYASYDSNFSLAPEFESRIPLYNLYPLLVHLNLFGSGYYGSVIQNLRLFM